MIQGCYILLRGYDRLQIGTIDYVTNNNSMAIICMIWITVHIFCIFQKGKSSVASLFSLRDKTALFMSF